MNDHAPPPPVVDAAWAWDALGIPATRDETEVRRAYSKLLKAIDPDTDPAAFMALRDARDMAMFAIRNGAVSEAMSRVEPDEDDAVPASAASLPQIGEAPQASTPEPRVETIFQAPLGDKSEIDPALFTRIEQLVFGPAETVDFAELRLAGEALLDHPLLERLGTSESVQNWIGNVIVNGSPRSDALIAPAVQRFRWDDDLDNWQRPQVLDWIVQRRADSAFERNLVADYPKYGEVLRYLRDPDAAPPARPGLGLCADMRAFLIYARNNHPTTLALSDAEAVAWWEGWVFNPPGFLRRELEALHRTWFCRDRPDGLFQPRPRPISGQLALGIFLFPPVFAWATIRPGHNWFIRAASVAWMAIYLYTMANYQPPPPQTPRSPPPYSYAPSHSPLYQDANADIDGILLRYGDRDLTTGTLERANPALYVALMDLWRTDRDAHANYSWFAREMETAVWDDYRAGIRGGDYEIQAAWWHLRADILAWMANDGSEGRSCVAYMTGDGEAIIHPVFLRRTNALVGRVLRRPGRRDVPALASGEDYGFRIPDAVFEGAMARSHYDRPTLRAALNGGGTPEQRCVATIALIETTLALPSMQMTPFLREMSRGL